MGDVYGDIRGESMTVHVGAGMLLHGYPCWSEESLDFKDVLDELLHEAGALEPCSQQRRGGWLSDDFLRILIMIFVYVCEMLEFNLFIFFQKFALQILQTRNQPKW